MNDQLPTPVAYAFVVIYMITMGAGYYVFVTEIKRFTRWLIGKMHQDGDA